MLHHHIDQKTIDAIRLFALFDRNRDGSISQSDLRSFFFKSFQMKLSRDNAREVLVQINRELHVQKKQMDRVDFDTFALFMMDVAPGEFCRGKSLVIQYGRAKQGASSPNLGNMSQSPSKSLGRTGSNLPRLPKLTTNSPSTATNGLLTVPRATTRMVSPLSPGSPRQSARDRANSPFSHTTNDSDNTHLPSIHNSNVTSPNQHKKAKRANQNSGPNSLSPTARDQNRLTSLFGFNPQKKSKPKGGLKDWLGREQQQEPVTASPRKARISRSVKKSHFSDSKIITTSTQKKEERKKMETMLRETFNIIDADNDQLISVSDFTHCMQQILRINMTPKQVNEISEFFEKKELDWDDFVLLLARVYSVEL